MATIIDERQEFMREVAEGLSQPQKRISAKYFYDDEGSRIFQQIMDLPEYYLARSESEILQTKADDIYDALGSKGHINIVELGAGDGSKTVHFLRHLLERKVEFTYVPIDISEEANRILEQSLREQLPSLDVVTETGDYFDVLRRFNHGESATMLMFMGSNLGNFPPPMNIEMMQLMADNMRPGDHLLLGVDLKKHPAIVGPAYSDAAGVTAAFNHNLLRRMNTELGANFDIGQWDFYSYYDPISGEVKSFLVSRVAQSVHIEAIEETYSFDRHETIWTELSKKYSLPEIKQLGKEVGLKQVDDFLDKKSYFTDTLFIKP